MPLQTAERLALQHQRDLATIAGGVTSVVASAALGADPAAISTWYFGAVDALLARIQAGHAQARRASTEYLRKHAAINGVDLTPVPASLDMNRARTSLRVTGPVAFKTAIGSGLDEDQALRSMASQMSGSSQRLVLAGDRDTFEQTLFSDRGIIGWRRRLSGVKSCGFCAMLASRGAVYASRKTASVARDGLKFHDACRCWPEPMYSHEEEPPEVRRLQRQWQRVTAGETGKGKARAWRNHWENEATDVGRFQLGLAPRETLARPVAEALDPALKMKVAELTKLAKDNGIPLFGATKKHDIILTIRQWESDKLKSGGRILLPDGPIGKPITFTRPAITAPPLGIPAAGRPVLSGAALNDWPDYFKYDLQQGRHQFVNAAGNTVAEGVRVRDLRVSIGAMDGSYPSYVVHTGTAWRIDGVSYLIEHGPDEFGAPWVSRALTELQAAHKAIPAALKANKSYTVLRGSSPADVYWQKRFNNPSHRGAMSAGGGHVTVWNFEPRFSRIEEKVDLLRHETGHNLDDLLGRTLAGSESPAWTRAADLDAASAAKIKNLTSTHHEAESLATVEPGRGFPKGVTQYGRSSVGEDYAESVMLYQLGPIATGRLPGVVIPKVPGVPRAVELLPQPKTALTAAEQARVRALVRRDPQIFATVQDRFGPISTSGNLSRADAAWLQSVYERERAFVERAVQEASIRRDIEAAAKKAGQTPTAYRAEVAAKLTDLLADKPIAVRVRDEAALSDILSGGRFKTQLEGAKRAPGLPSSPARRRLAEEILGVPTDLPIAERPIYGYVAINDIEPALAAGRRIPGIRELEGQEDVLSSYGRVQIVLRPEVRARTTATVGDSLDEIGFLRPTPVDAPTAESLGFRKLEDITRPEFTRRGYVEAQVHGGVSVEDIAAVIFAEAPDQATIAALARQQIPWRVLVKGDTPLKLSEIAPTVTGLPAGARIITNAEVLYFRDIYPRRAAILDKQFPDIAKAQKAEIAALRAPKVGGEFDRVLASAKKGNAATAQTAYRFSGNANQNADLFPDRPHRVAIMDAFAGYRGIGSKRINEALRKGGEITDARIALMDEAFAVSPLRGDVVVYRGARGTFEFGPPETWGDSLVGRTWTESAYTSTSVNPEKARPFASDGVLLRIVAPRGTPAVGIRPAMRIEAREQEILLGRGLTFRVVRDHGDVAPSGLSIADPHRAAVRRVLDVEIVPQNLETAARARQTILDQRRTVAEALAEVEELLANQASARALRNRANGIALRAEGEASKTLAPIVKAMQTGDEAKIRTALTGVRRRGQYETVGGEAGTFVRFDRATMESIGPDIADGEWVFVVRPGLVADVDGERVRIMRAAVQEMTPPADVLERMAAAERAAAVKALSKKTVAELRALAVEQKLVLPPKATKAQILEALQMSPAERKAAELRAVRAAARERNKLIEAATGTEKLLAHLDEVLAKGADAKVIRQALDEKLITPEQVFGNADPAVLAALKAAFADGDVAKLRAAITRQSTARKLKVVGGKAGAKVKFDPEVMEAVGGGEIKAGTQVQVVTRGSSVTLPDGTVMQLTKAKVQPVPRESLGSLLDRASNGAKVKDEVAALIDGKIGDYTVAVTRVGFSTVVRGSLDVRGIIRTADGKQAGKFLRTYHRDAHGDLVAHHDFLQLGRTHQGQGLAQEFNDKLFAWYRQSGVARVELTANVDIGGYAWASAGFDFADARAADGILNRLEGVLIGLRRGDFTPADIRKLFQGASPAQVQSMIKDASELLARARSSAFTAPGFPTAYEISQLGRWAGAGKANGWIGKLVMLESRWDAVFPLS